MDPTTDIATEIATGIIFPTRADSPGTLAFTRDQRWRLLSISILAYAATAFALSVFPIFRTPGFGGSLLLDANPIIALTITVVWIAIVFLAAAFTGASVRPDVGIFAAAVALLAIRRSGGVTRDVYLAKPTASTLQMLLLEVVVLGAVLAGCAFVTRKLIARGTLLDDAALDGVRPVPEPLGQKVLATITHFLVFSVIVLLTVRSDERMQVTAMLAIASILASICTVRFIPATPSFFFWMSPMLAGIVAYLVTSLTGTGNLSIGEPAGYCGALARALPLDFASAGVAGAIYGYWIGRGWIPPDALEKPKP